MVAPQNYADTAPAWVEPPSTTAGRSREAVAARPFSTVAGDAIAFAGRAAVLWYVSLLMVPRQHGLLPAVAIATGTALVCSGCVDWARRATRAVRAAVGTVVTTVAGLFVGTVLLSALALWTSAALSPKLLLMIGATAAVPTLVWEGFLARAVKHPSRVLVVGATPAGRELVETVATEASSGCRIVGFADDGDIPRVAGLPVLGRVADVADVVARTRPDLVVLAVDDKRADVCAGLARLTNPEFAVVGVPEFCEHVLGRVPVRELTPLWFMSLLHLYQRPYSLLAKRLFDIAVAAIGIVVAAPLLPLIVLLVRSTGPSVLYRQTRLGRGGRRFTIYKFRTMRSNAEADGRAVWAAVGDPRVTRVGHRLRQMRLDELPQLWNVLKGEMSIVGPRPERPEHTSLLCREVPYWAFRHLVKPGITGWAQLSSGYAADCATTERKLAHDLWYLRHRSVWLDLVICVKTVQKLVSGSGAR